MGARRTLLNKWPFMAFEFNVAHFRQKKDKSHYTFIRSRIIRINFSVKLTEPEDAVDIDNTILYKFQYQIPKYQTHKNTTYRAEKLIVPQTETSELFHTLLNIQLPLQCCDSATVPMKYSYQRRQ